MVGAKAAANIGHASIQICGRNADLAPVERFPMRARSLLRMLGLGRGVELDPAMAAALERTSEQTCAGLERRERLAEGLLAAATVAGAVALVLAEPLSHRFDPALAPALGTAYAIAPRVRFPHRGGYTAPPPPVFVPVGILLPPSPLPL